MLAQNDFDAGNGKLALHYLDECQWKLRGWEHRYLWTRINAKQTLVGHKRDVYGVAFSPDGKRIVTAGFDNTARVWGAGTGQELFALKGHTCWVVCVAFSPDGNHIVTGAGEWGFRDTSPRGEAKVWDAVTGQELVNLSGLSSPVWSVAFSPDGKRIVTGLQDQTAMIWDAETGRDVLAFKCGGELSSVAFSPDGNRIITAGGTAKLWDAGTGREILALKGHSVRCVAFSPDGKRLVTGSEDQTASIWDAGTGQELLTLRGHASWVWSVAFSPDGQRIVTGSWDNTVRVWDAASGHELLILKGHAGKVRGVAVSADGRHIVSGSDDWTAKVWDAQNGQEVVTLPTEAVFGLAFSPTGKRIVVSGFFAAKVWDAETGHEVLALNGHKGPVLCVAYSPDGKRIVTGGDDQTAKVWNALTGQELLTLKRLPTKAISPGVLQFSGASAGGLLTVAFSPDGGRIVTGSADGAANVWDAETGQQLLVLEGHKGSVVSAAFSPEGTRIVAGCGDSRVMVWDGERTSTPHSQWARRPGERRGIQP